jgi:CDP-glucose 4,6-dehydratase
MFGGCYQGRRVLVTGHTGFKGTWLSAWLLELGARVAGYALEPPSTPSNFAASRLLERIRHFHGDIRDRERLSLAFAEFQPEVVFHLAAQALVRPSYEEPAGTFETNVLGTLNVLECLRNQPGIGAAVLITSDKAYRNVEWTWGYRENDTLGGEDPYSGSKGAAELVAYSYFHSFFKGEGRTAVATARAGNVIGGGDWARDRIVPDCMRSWSRGETVEIRSPAATRPWQHVLEPLSGYLLLGSELWKRNERVNRQSYNFGPNASVNQPVFELLSHLAKDWPGADVKVDPAGTANRPEAVLLKLCCDKALADLRWQAVLSFDETVRLTSRWYRRYYSEPAQDMFPVTLEHIREYCALAQSRQLPWSLP